MTPNKPEWFELSEADSASSGIRKINKKLPIAAIVAAGSIILGGALFANANDEPSASASTTSVTAASSPGANTSGATTSSATSSTNSISSPTATSAPKVSITPITNAKGNSERSGDDGKIGDRDHSDDENEGYEHENEDEDD